MVTGHEQPDGGTIKLGDSVKLAYVEQSRDALKADDTVWQSISDGAEFIKLGNVNVNSRSYCTKFTFVGADQQRKVGTLSAASAPRPPGPHDEMGANVLLLDEPTNDFDVNAIRALEEALENFAGCAIVISHDRWFLDRLATHILAFEATAGSCSTTATTAATRPTSASGSARTPTSRTGSSTGS